MKRSGESSKLVKFSQWLFQRLLIAYPRGHRVEYGAAMEQLFRDQCRDAWNEAGRRGLLLLWLRVLPDLLKTSLLEHVANLKGKKSMANKMFTGVHSSSAVRSAFLIVFVFAFCSVFMTSIIVTFLLPETFESLARIKIERSANIPNMGGRQTMSGNYDPYFIQTECEVMQSEVILDKVIDQLDLNEIWRRKYNYEGKFKTSESRRALKRMIELRPSPNRNMVEIVGLSDDRSEAAKIANAVAKNYQTYRQKSGQLLTRQALHDVLQERAAQNKKINPENEEAAIAEIMTEVNRRSAGKTFAVEVIETAEPSLRPVRPNKPLNIFLGGVSAGLIGLLAGGLVALIVSRLQKRWGKTPPPVPITPSKF